MSREITQDDCRKRWEALRQHIIDEISVIDRDTPATPYEEPMWWVNMCEVDRHVRDLKDKNVTWKRESK